MKSNILKAMHNMTVYGSNELLRFYVGNNRANNMGDALEIFVKDIFCNSFSFSIVFLASCFISSFSPGIPTTLLIYAISLQKIPDNLLNIAIGLFDKMVDGG